jgi:hypothetical protein
MKLKDQWEGSVSNNYIFLDHNEAIVRADILIHLIEEKIIII